MSVHHLRGRELAAISRGAGSVSRWVGTIRRRLRRAGVGSLELRGEGLDVIAVETPAASDLGYLPPVMVVFG